MKLDRNINPDKRGKYAILLLRDLEKFRSPDYPHSNRAAAIGAALRVLEDAGVIDWGITGTDKEFFLIRLKDKYAEAGLRNYARAAAADDEEYANEVFEMANRAGPNSPFCKRPD